MGLWLFIWGSWGGHCLLVLYWHISYANQGIRLIIKETRERLRLEIQLKFQNCDDLSRTLSCRKQIDNKFQMWPIGHNTKHLCFIFYCWVCPFPLNPIKLYLLNDSCLFWEGSPKKRLEETQKRFLIVYILPTQFIKPVRPFKAAFEKFPLGLRTSGVGLALSFTGSHYDD